ncbi:MAG: hypothetical protein ACFFBP_06320 [Promethearchaeota archaeon]
MSNENENINYNEINKDLDNEKLRNEIKHLNSQIIEKINSINTIDTESIDKFHIMNILKDIIIAQRQEIIWKHDDIKKLELDVIDLAHKITSLGEPHEQENKRVDIAKDYHRKIDEMNITIEELLKKNADNQEIINKLREESNPEFWENQISELNKVIIDLTDENASLRKNLKNADNTSNKEQLETELSDLRQQIIELKEENKKIEEKNKMLKAALLMTVDTETKNLTDSPETLTDDTVIEFETTGDKKVAIHEGPSAVKAFQESLESSERRRQCPNCGASGAFILEIDDKSNIIYQDMGNKIYGKKYKCGECRHEWK